MAGHVVLQSQQIQVGPVAVVGHVIVVMIEILIFVVKDLRTLTMLIPQVVLGNVIVGINQMALVVTKIVVLVM